MAETNPDPPLGSYFVITFQTLPSTIYRGKSFEISWEFQGREPLEDDLINLYANEELIYSTVGIKNTSYMYTPTKAGPLRLQIKMDTQRTDVSEIIDTDTTTLTVRDTTIDDDIDYIAELLVNTLQKQGVICSVEDGLTTLIDKTCHIRRDIDEIPLDDALTYIKSHVQKVGGTSGRAIYTLNNDKTYITREVNGWSHTDECQFANFTATNHPQCFETIFKMQDAKERPSICIRGDFDNNEEFYYKLGITDDNSAAHYSVLTTDKEALDISHLPPIASNLCDVRSSDIISMRIYVLLDHIYYQIYNMTTDDILFQYKQSFDNNILVTQWCFGINIGYFGSRDNRGNVSQISHISLSSLATPVMPNLFEPSHQKITLAEDIGYIGSRLKSALQSIHILNQDHNGLTSLIKKIPQVKQPDIYNPLNWTSIAINNGVVNLVELNDAADTIAVYSAGQHLLNTEFTHSKYYTLEFDFYSRDDYQKGVLLFGDSLFRRKFCLTAGGAKTYIEESTYDNNAEETRTTIYTEPQNYLPSGWVHIKIVRQDTIAFIFIGDALFYTLTNLVDCTNVFGLWRRGEGHIQIKNIKLSNVNFVHTQTLAKTGYLLDTNNYTYLKGTSGGISRVGLNTIQLDATRYVLHNREFTHSKKYILTFEIKMSYGRDAGFIIGNNDDYMTWTQQEEMEILQHGSNSNDGAYSAFGQSSSSNRYTSFIPVVIMRNNNDWTININNGEFIHTCQYDFANKFGFRAWTSGNVQIKNLKIYHDSFDYVAHSLSELDTALTNIKEGESLYIAEGEYTLTKQYSLPSCTIIGNNATIKEYGFKFNKNTHTPIEISGLKFICNTIKSYNPLIAIDTSADVHIYDCEWDNIRQQWDADNITIGVASPDYNIEIDHCIFKGPNYCREHGHSKASICCWGDNSTVYNINIHHNIFNHSISNGSENLYNGRAICFVDATLNNCIAHHNVYIGEQDYNDGIDEEYVLRTSSSIMA